MKATVRTRLGPLEAFTSLPARVATGSREFFLVRDEGEFRLLSNICPHQGGAIYDEGTRFECPQHGWRFDRDSGRCLNAPKHAMASSAVAIEDGVLYADLPRHAGVAEVESDGSVTKPGLTIDLHAHACLEISYQGFALLTDPWLDGPAFLGAWAPYPPHEASGAHLRPNGILITHEHSDHFHEPTLQRFDRETPIYVPDFPNQRMLRRLSQLGFRDVRVLRFGVPAEPAKGWRIITFEPVSYWNDALVLIEVDGFRILDINDAGINAHIARLVAPVDVLALQFSGGASGYPWTWGHLSDAEKIDISARDCSGKLRMIREAATVYRARSVLPFASHFTLWHPEHRAYAGKMKRNTLADVRACLEGSGVRVIDLLPGDRWDGDDDAISRRSVGGDGLFETERLAAYMRTAVDQTTFERSHPFDVSLSRQELTDYLLGLNDVPEISHCEDLSVRICSASANGHCEPLDVGFAVQDGRLDVLPIPPERPNVTMTIPHGVLTAVVREGLSWDEAFIGFWCRFDRDPNVYHAGFWRLLQAPYFQRGADPRRRETEVAITPGSTVADVLEAHGALADRILRRYGLYCCGCHHSTAESIEMAARQHGMEARRVGLLIQELNRAFGGVPDSSTSSSSAMFEQESETAPHG